LRAARHGAGRTVAVCRQQRTQTASTAGGQRFADLGPHLSCIVHDAIVELQPPMPIERSLRTDVRPSELRLCSPRFVAGRFGAAVRSVTTNEVSTVNYEPAQPYPLSGPGYGYRPEQSIHDDPLLLLDITKLVRTLFRAGTVSVDGKAFGTDKIIHFIHLGHIYYSTYQSARRQGLDESTAAAQAVQLSSGDHLLLSENWLLGTFTTGIRSNADLAANYAGFMFYRNLTEPVPLGNQLMGPMLVRHGVFWRLNEQTQPDSDFFTAFVSLHWNEALNPSVCRGTGPMRSLRAAAVPTPDWYRNEQDSAWASRSSRRSAELSYYTEDGCGRRRIPSAILCFQSEPAGFIRLPGSTAYRRGEQICTLRVVGGHRPDVDTAARR
jgi:hypothetical protein